MKRIMLKWIGMVSMLLFSATGLHRKLRLERHI